MWTIWLKVKQAKGENGANSILEMDKERVNELEGI